MKYLKAYLIAGIIMVLCLLFLMGEVINLKQLVLWSRVLIFPFLLLFYVQKVKKHKLYFVLFLSFFAVAEAVRFLVLNFGLQEKYGDVISYTRTSLYILSHLSLLMVIVSGIKIKYLFKSFPLHFYVLVPFGFYLLYALDNMITYNGAASMTMVDYILVTIYNIMIILILIFSLLSYLYRETRKALLLFIACSCIVFSELVKTAYYFMAREGLLGLVYTALLASGFFMLYVFMTHKDKSLGKKNNLLTNSKRPLIEAED